ncbi:hypothetical protein JDV02_007736 [Purpureocillium takamizusanense]|uniref:Uncharacterized protein n=1 Tax=Purpureocillium takamizusanense TaxID=2060973 RepID=A0A9Q8QLF5_9HYPO|nr:uncharacterized protein JDV02_007736 [Purpureocillium takamizusanense]UNI21780.1 hypothetical protein JDV02_007736 [Purpureocillium takamizusanense]
MARGKASNMPSHGAGSMAGSVDKDREAFEMRQYELILQLQDTILSGRHPTIRPPKDQSAIIARPPADGYAVPSTVTDAKHANRTGGAQSSSTSKAKGKGKAPAVAKASTSSGTGPLATRAVEFDPILLEKSEELVQAELMLQRQRLERALKDEVDRRRGPRASQAEKQNAELDLSDVLSKAQALVPAVQDPPPPTATATAAAATMPAEDGLTDNKDAESDSFDDDTFYSSQHETPQSHMASRVRNASEAAHSPTVVAREPPPPAQAAPQQPPGQQPTTLPGQPTANAVRRVDAQPISLANAPTAAPQPRVVPGLNNYIGVEEASTRFVQAPTSGEQSLSDDSAHMDYEPPEAEDNMSCVAQRIDSYMEMHPPSPHIRSHALQPLAPQPSQVSLLVAASQGRMPHQQTIPRTHGTPAQVAALRNEHSTATSPDSSSQGGKGSERKKARKKKRKADRQAPDANVSPYIKPEPRSPSPIFAPEYRANKRQRQAQGRVVDLEYEPRFEPPPANGNEGQVLTRPYRDEPIPLGYEGASVYPQRAASTTYLGESRYVRQYVDDHRIPAEGHLRSYGPQSALPVQYPPPTVGYASRQVPPPLAGDGYREQPRPYGEFPGDRVRVASDGESYGAPPGAAPPRMVVDEFGREYYDPAHPAVQRPMAPSVSPGEPGVVYERLPPRTASRQAGLEPRSDAVRHSAQAPPAYAVMPRRIVTQPEYAGYDYRDTHGREYSARPMAPPAEFVEVGGPRERRFFGEAPGHLARAPSTIPADAVRYHEMPPSYGRVQSVRPEVPVREYAASVHPDSRRELAQPYVRNYGAPPLGDYRHSSHAPPGGEIAFIERPRGATQEIVYADDARREIYR